MTSVSELDATDSVAQDEHTLLQTEQKESKCLVQTEKNSAGHLMTIPWWPAPTHEWPLLSYVVLAEYQAH